MNYKSQKWFNENFHRLSFCVYLFKHWGFLQIHGSQSRHHFRIKTCDFSVSPSQINIVLFCKNNVATDRNILLKCLLSIFNFTCYTLVSHILWGKSENRKMHISNILKLCVRAMDWIFENPSWEISTWLNGWWYMFYTFAILLCCIPSHPLC